MKTGLFFGTFNPVHIGHMIIANYMATQTDLDEVWLVVSPHNPLKDKSTLANDYDRLHLVNLAIGDNVKLKSSDIEFHLPKPSYTIDTLIHLKEKYPKKEFVLIMGSDNLSNLHKWKNFELLLRDYQIYVYDRPEHTQGPYRDHSSVKLFDVPLMYLSATFVRDCIKSGKSIQYLVPESVYEYIGNTNIYS